MISINVDVEINTKQGQSNKVKYGRLPKHASKGEEDECSLEYKKVIKQTLYKGIVGDMGINNMQKSCGPFTVEKPVNLSKYDVDKFGLYL